MGNNQSVQPGPSTESDPMDDNIFPCFMPEDPCVNKIVEWINSFAKNSIIVQAYRFSSKKIAEALIGAKKRGVTVEIMIDKYAREKPNNLIRELEVGGIEIIVDQLPGIAHNKVMIIDDEHVITGSYNWTDEQFYHDSDDIIFIHNACVNEKFRNSYEALSELQSKNKIPRNARKRDSNHFNEVSETKRFHSDTYHSNPFISLDGIGSCCHGVTSNFFSASSIHTDEDGLTESTTRNEEKKQKSEDFFEVLPCFPKFNNQDCINLITGCINDAKESVFIQACSLTHRKILCALLDAHEKDIIIKLLVDKKAFDDEGEQVSTLNNSGIEVRCNTTCHPGIAHSKTIIIDDDLVLTGSLNLTKRAQDRNRENLLRIKNLKVNKMYKEKFDTKWNKSPSINETRKNV